MAEKRKLQAEIERVLKKVSEGVEEFEDIWEKVHTAQNASQKEKYEADLKKEIKKLQRLRDQIKTWLTSNDVKDKTELMKNRKLIETQMERFKIVERETKTKTFSKEGLSMAAKMDPAEKAKMEQRDWINSCTERLNMQIDQFEAEIEQLIGKRKKKPDRALEDRKSYLESCIEKHREHEQKLEVILRLLDNDTLSTDDVQGLQEDVEYYIDSNQEPDFEENEYIYDVLPVDLQEIIDAEDMEETVLGGVKKEEEPEPEKEKPKETKPAEKPPARASASAAVPPTLKTSTSALPPRAASSTTATPSASVSSPATVPSPAPPATTATPVAAVVSAPVTPAAAAAIASVPPSPAQPPASAPLSVMPAPSPRLPVASPATTSLPPPATVSAPSPPSQPAPQVSTTTQPTPPQTTPPLPQPSQAPQQSVTPPISQSPFTAPHEPHQNDHMIQSNAVLAGLQASFQTMPQPPDSERVKPYVARNPVATPPYYPSVPAALTTKPGIFEKMDTDTLFFIFYYQAGSYQQYLAARELKKQSWRFHKKYSTWFQRHDEPKTITDEYEQGTYVYFDYESGWCQRKKTDFTFEYRYLEDENL